MDGGRLPAKARRSPSPQRSERVDRPINVNYGSTLSPSLTINAEPGDHAGSDDPIYHSDSTGSFRVSDTDGMFTPYH